MPDSAIPEFFVYGEPARPLDVGFLHVETVMARHTVHFGRVAAHKHPQLAQITFWTCGRGLYRIEEQAWSFSAPAASFVPSDVVHGFTIEPGTDAIVVSIANDALAGIAGHSLLPLETPVFVAGRAEDPLWRRLAATLELIQAEHAEALAGADTVLLPLIAVALSNLARLRAGAPALAVPAALALATRLRRLVDRHFREDWPVERYVEALGTTRHLLDKAARRAGGRGVKDMVSERRLVEAKRLLLFTIRGIEDIAYEIGFEDAAYFSRFFRHRVGEPPAAWRRRQLGRS
ncbi:helix-turn-helix domain-containing protein [Labrys wisconsinensis]|uniref:AraC family transcriptional activator of pobA n=1 Tax=Labrys wisconsinensis TaxID=425677 RepID=A0ABU0JBX9_9HYPH|nr:helix-turn-helix domain-containing protein [Labrys wisconsinensis]MDQ0471787.1 AraC family transcriptional activator of pobA [Labrys wisconsinensis]